MRSLPMRVMCSIEYSDSNKSVELILANGGSDQVTEVPTATGGRDEPSLSQSVTPWDNLPPDDRKQPQGGWTAEEGVQGPWQEVSQRKGGGVGKPIACRHDAQVPVIIWYT